MKKFLLGAAGLVAALSMAAPASAADMGVPYVKAPAMVAAIYDWSGLYIGVNGGVFRATVGLQQRFGRERVIDTLTEHEHARILLQSQRQRLVYGLRVRCNPALTWIRLVVHQRIDEPFIPRHKSVGVHGPG